MIKNSIIISILFPIYMLGMNINRDMTDVVLRVAQGMHAGYLLISLKNPADISVFHAGTAAYLTYSYIDENTTPAELCGLLTGFALGGILMPYTIYQDNKNYLS